MVKVKELNEVECTHMPLTQPTATFAKQKLYESNNLPFNFKSCRNNNSKTYYNDLEPQLEVLE